MDKPYTRETVSIEGAELGVTRWPGSAPVIGIHGLASNGRAFASLADELSPEVGVLAPDLRGRGRSEHAGGPYGLARHADDVAAVAAALGVSGPRVVVGHSMGAYVALVLAARHASLVRALVLVDGGAPLPELPDGTVFDVDALFASPVGPLLEPLRTPWPDAQAVLAERESTALFAGRDDDAMRRYVIDSVVPGGAGVRHPVDLDAVAADATDVFAGAAVRDAYADVRCPVVFVRAMDGLNGSGDEVISDEEVAALAEAVPDLRVHDLVGENHMSVLVGRDGAPRVAAIARALCDDAA